MAIQNLSFKHQSSLSLKVKEIDAVVMNKEHLFLLNAE